ncbi:MAG: hypothetical protein JNG85_17345, partial [Spirochaetaceae bacterium]|nr:hypothetical protein [Spirochaetaceae bacterium]
MDAPAYRVLAAAAGLAALVLLAPLALLQLRSRRLSRISAFDSPRSFTSPLSLALLATAPALAVAHA